MKSLDDVNAVCEQAAAEIGVRPAEAEIDLGKMRYRFVKTFTVRPAAPLAGSVLDFSQKTMASAILQGYRDATEQVENLLAYARDERPKYPRQILRVAPGTFSTPR